MKDLKRYLEIGKIVSIHGIKGEVKILPMCDSPHQFAEISQYFTDENGKNSLTLKNARVHKNMVIALFDNYSTIELAETLRNKTLYVDRDVFVLPENTYFLQDLIGLEVFDVDTMEKYGEISDVLQTGANDVYVVKGAKEYLIPAIADVIIETNIPENKMLIRPLKGLFDI